jgi:hypothetical protein
MRLSAVFMSTILDRTAFLKNLRFLDVVAVLIFITANILGKVLHNISL